MKQHDCVGVNTCVLFCFMCCCRCTEGARIREDSNSTVHQPPEGPDGDGWQQSEHDGGAERYDPHLSVCVCGVFPARPPGGRWRRDEGRFTLDKSWFFISSVCVSVVVRTHTQLHVFFSFYFLVMFSIITSHDKPLIKMRVQVRTRSEPRVCYIRIFHRGFCPYKLCEDQVSAASFARSPYPPPVQTWWIYWWLIFTDQVLVLRSPPSKGGVAPWWAEGDGVRGFPPPAGGELLHTADPGGFPRGHWDLQLPSLEPVRRGPDPGPTHCRG